MCRLWRVSAQPLEAMGFCREIPCPAQILGLMDIAVPAAMWKKEALFSRLQIEYRGIVHVELFDAFQAYWKLGVLTTLQIV